MIINKFLQLFSEEYIKTKSIDGLIEFTKKTLPSNGCDRIFIGCVLIMYEEGITGPSACREYLLSILKSGKKKVGDTNLLFFYVMKINKSRLVAKYLKNINKDAEFDKHLNIVLEYLEQFSYDFTKIVKKSYDKKIRSY